MSAYYHTEEKKYIKTKNHPELAGWNGKITVLGAKKNYYSNSFLCMNVPIKKYQAPTGRNGAYYLPAWIFENSSRRTKLMENIANRRYDEKIPRKRPVGKI